MHFIRASTKGRNLAFVPVRAFLNRFYKGTFRAQTGTIVHSRNFLVPFRPYISCKGINKRSEIGSRTGAMVVLVILSGYASYKRRYGRTNLTETRFFDALISWQRIPPRPMPTTATTSQKKPLTTLHSKRISDPQQKGCSFMFNRRYCGF